MKYSAQKLGMQRGAAALATSIILLLVVTLVVLFAGKVLVMDKRMAGNEYRYNKAMANAEAGLENRSAFLLHSGETGVLFGTTFNHLNTMPYFSSVITPTTSALDINSIGYAYGTDQTQGQATVRQSYGYYKLINKGPDAPLIVAGNVPPVGNMEIVGNPNAGGPGVNVAIWTNLSVTPGGSYATCKSAEYWANGNPSVDPATGIKTCSANSCACTGTLDGRISTASANGRDIVIASYPAFPNDVFKYVTGFAHADYQNYIGESKITKITPAQCSTLSSNSNGIFWVSGTGQCSLPGGNVGGAAGNNCGKSASNVCAVVLFVENVDVKYASGDNKFFGIIFSFDRTTTIAANGSISDSAPGDNGYLQMTGSNAVYGVLMSDHSLQSGSSIVGSFDLVYNRQVLEEITNDKQNQSLARVSGTWIDQ